MQSRIVRAKIFSEYLIWRKSTNCKIAHWPLHAATVGQCLQFLQGKNNLSCLVIGCIRYNQVQRVLREFFRQNTRKTLIFFVIHMYYFYSNFMLVVISQLDSYYRSLNKYHVSIIESLQNCKSSLTTLSNTFVEDFICSKTYFKLTQI